jgi:hypothetical protein
VEDSQYRFGKSTAIMSESLAPGELSGREPAVLNSYLLGLHDTQLVA